MTPDAGERRDLPNRASLAGSHVYTPILFERISAVSKKCGKKIGTF
jgi:hypothetical protein